MTVDTATSRVIFIAARRDYAARAMATRFSTRLCGDDEASRQRVELLLQAHVTAR